MNLPMPLMAHWQDSHYVIVEKIGTQTATVVDPNQGRHRIDRREFDENFSGVVLTMKPGPDFFTQRRPRFRTLRFLAGYIPAGPSTAMLLASAALVALGLLPTVFTQHLIDAVIPNGAGSLMWAFGAAALALTIGTAGMGYLRSSLLLRIRTKIDATVMSGFLKHMLSLPYPYFQVRTIGDLLTRANSSQMIRESLTTHTLSLLLDGISSVVYVSLLIFTFPPVGLLVLFIGVTEFAIAFAFAQPVRHATRRQIQFISSAQGSLIESLNGIEEMKATASETAAFGKWNTHYTQQMDASVAHGRLTNRIAVVFDTFRVLSPLAVLWCGAWWTINGDATIGTLVAASTLAGMTLGPFTNMTQAFQALQNLGIHVSRIKDVLDEKPEPRGTIPRSSVHGKVEVSDVRFSHQRGAKPTVRDVTFSAGAGSMVAIVGATGSGKSTLARVLLGLYAPDKGEISIDGVVLQDENRYAFREHFGVVAQDTALYTGSIKDNLTTFAPEVGIDRIVQAARLACIHDEIEALPMGYLTPLGERGTGLSGGQLQRLAIARALLREPRLLVLDEATSHLDTVTEGRIFENLATIGCTRIVISHRLKSIRAAERILVMHEGALVESGSHEALVRSGGRYSEMVGAADRSAEQVPLTLH
ncbi:peptidase C39 [Amycolatopsis oliviviridis]|uniref:Peptidase C39 n=1 Tax=Amycolatopsis oliviviridis TaxID=1471590 RepID=A0ABQ3MF60_9PSEU|nr:peptidase C39 [Amycolatopsis oliviviridis]